MTHHIFIDGLPGSGKSESGRNLATALVTAGHPARFCMETDADNPLQTIDLDPMGAVFADAHLRTTPEEFAAKSLDRYRSLASQLSAEASTLPSLIFDSFPMQSHVRVLMQMNASPEFVTGFWDQLQDAIRPIAPALVYFEESDVEGAMRRILSHRGSNWEAYVIAALEQSPYATSRGLAGVEGAIQMMTDYNDLADSLVGSWRFDQITLPARPADYKGRDNVIRDFFVNW